MIENSSSCLLTGAEAFYKQLRHIIGDKAYAGLHTPRECISHQSQVGERGLNDR